MDWTDSFVDPTLQAPFSNWTTPTHIPILTPTSDPTLSPPNNSILPITMEFIMLKCTTQLSLMSPAYFNLSASEQLHYNCDFCNLSLAELDVLYADTTCLKSKFNPMPVFCLMYGLVFVLGLVGNALVLWAVVTGGRALSSVMHLFIANLAMGDLLMVVLCIPFTVTALLVLHYWPFGYMLCVGVSYLQAVSVFVSAYSLVAISLDRYMAIIYPLRPRITRLQARAVIATVWSLAFLTCIPVAHYSTLEVPVEGYHLHHNLSVCHEHWPEDHQHFRQCYALALLILHYFLPVTVMIFTYSRIAWRVWGSKESADARAIKAYVQISSTPGNAGDRGSVGVGGPDFRPHNEASSAMASNHHNSVSTHPEHSPTKMIRMTVTVVLVYSLCWLPFNVLMVAQDHHPELMFLSGFHLFWAGCHWLAMAHTVFNPAVLYWLNTTIRLAVLRMVCRVLPPFCHRHLANHLHQLTPQRLHRSATYCTTSCGLNHHSAHPMPSLVHHHHGSLHHHHHRFSSRSSTRSKAQTGHHGRESPDAPCIPLSSIQSCDDSLQPYSNILQQADNSLQQCNITTNPQRRWSLPQNTRYDDSLLHNYLSTVAKGGMILPTETCYDDRQDSQTGDFPQKDRGTVAKGGMILPTETCYDDRQDSQTGDFPQKDRGSFRQRSLLAASSGVEAAQIGNGTVPSQGANFPECVRNVSKGVEEQNKANMNIESFHNNLARENKSEPMADVSARSEPGITKKTSPLPNHLCDAEVSSAVSLGEDWDDAEIVIPEQVDDSLNVRYCRNHHMKSNGLQKVARNTTMTSPSFMLVDSIENQHQKNSETTDFISKVNRHHDLTSQEDEHSVTLRRHGDQKDQDSRPSILLERKSRDRSLEDRAKVRSNEGENEPHLLFPLLIEEIEEASSTCGDHDDD